MILVAGLWTLPLGLATLVVASARRESFTPTSYWALMVGTLPLLWAVGAAGNELLQLALPAATAQLTPLQ